MSKEAYANALGAREEVRRAAKSKPVLRSIEIEKSENGGHTVTHRFKNGGDGPYIDSKEYVFGKSEGKKLVSHLSEHMGLNLAEDKDKDGE